MILCNIFACTFQYEKYKQKWHNIILSTVGFLRKVGVKILYPKYIKVDKLTSLKFTEPLHLLTVYVNSLWKI